MDVVANPVYQAHNTAMQSLSTIAETRTLGGVNRFAYFGTHHYHGTGYAVVEPGSTYVYYGDKAEELYRNAN